MFSLDKCNKTMPLLQETLDEELNCSILESAGGESEFESLRQILFCSVDIVLVNEVGKRVHDDDEEEVVLVEGW